MSAPNATQDSTKTGWCSSVLHWAKNPRIDDVAAFSPVLQMLSLHHLLLESRYRNQSRHGTVFFQALRPRVNPQPDSPVQLLIVFQLEAKATKILLPNHHIKSTRPPGTQCAKLDMFPSFQRGDLCEPSTYLKSGFAEITICA
jgi:hypothetical protein